MVLRVMILIPLEELARLAQFSVIKFQQTGCQVMVPRVGRTGTTSNYKMLFKGLLTITHLKLRRGLSPDPPLRSQLI